MEADIQRHTLVGDNLVAAGTLLLVEVDTCSVDIRQAAVGNRTGILDLAIGKPQRFSLPHIVMNLHKLPTR